MSLQARVLGTIFGLLIIALCCGSAVLIRDAQLAVRAEVATAFKGAVQSVQDTLRSDVQHTVTLRQVVASFQGQRHVRAALVNEAGRVIVSSHLGQPSGTAPS